MLRNHGPNNAYKNKHISTENTKYSISLSSPPHSQQLYHTETLYLPGYITQGAVLRVIKGSI